MAPHPLDPASRPKPSYRIVVPTRDSSRWIAAFHQAYRHLGIEPLYLFDIRSRDRTREILHTLGAEVITVEPAHDRVESMLMATRDIPSVDWVLRFDDDELPSAGLIEWLDRHLHQVVPPCLAISRRDVTYQNGQLCYSRLEDYYFHPQDPTFLDPQWRGFRPAEVRFTESLHTAGFHIGDFATVPQAAYFVHFDWILRSLEERLQKLRNYERQSPRAGWGFAQFYLPELHHPASCRWTPLCTDQFDELLADLLRVTA